MSDLRPARADFNLAIKTRRRTAARTPKTEKLMAAGILAAPGIMPARDRNGRAVVARIRIYQAGTTTPQAVYSSDALDTPLSQPVVSDDAGRFPLLWIDEAEGPVTLSWETDDGQVRTFEGLGCSTSADAALVDDATAALEAIEAIAGDAEDLAGYAAAAGTSASSASSSAAAAAASSLSASASSSAALTSATSAADSASSASTFANTASTAASTASASAAAAAARADDAAASESAATASAASASTSAGNASTAAAAAGDSATAAAGSAAAAGAAEGGAEAAQTAAEAARAAAETARDEAEAIAGFDPGDYLAKAGNLVGLADPATARTNIGLGDVDNTSDVGKPVSSAMQAALDLKAPIANPVFTGAVTLPGDPSTGLHAATKQYVDAVAAGLDPKPSVKCATVVNITLAGEQTIDGVSTSASRVLVKNQSAASQNGIYVSGSGAWTRAADADSWTELVGAFAFIEEGSTQADTGWVCTSDSGGTLGSTAVVFSRFTAPGDYTAGPGLSLSGLTFSLNINGQTEDAAPDSTADFIMTYDASAGGLKKVKPQNLRTVESLIVALGDETTAITAGTAKVTFRMPYAFVLTAVRASLTTASSSGAPTVDINEAGSSILSTKLAIDANELTSTTAATAAVISDASLADDAEITIDIDNAGTGAKGLKVYLIGRRA